MPEEVMKSPARLAWERFAAQRSSRFGLAVLAVIALMGIYAPFLSGEVALAWWDAEGFSLPILADLFNARTYPKPHDLLFNIVALLLPALLLAGWLLRRRLRTSHRIWLGLGTVVVVGLFCLVPVVPGRGGWHALWTARPDSTRTVQRYRAIPPGSDFPSALFPPVPHRFDATYPGAVLLAPGTPDPATASRFWLGTDAVGHDVLTLLLFGARISLTVGLVAVSISFLIGLVVGGISGYFGGWVDLILQSIVEIMMCFPTFILILIVVAMMGRDLFLIMAVIGLTSWAGTARLVRGEFMAQSVRDYVLAAEAMGLPRWRIMLRHILPNTFAPLLISLTFGIAGSIGSESGLAFVGLGDPTTPSWGILLEQGRQNIRYPWLIYTPGLAIFIIIMTLNLLGNRLREAVDVRTSE
jgi:peptide/nickel transport system permease protein